MQPVSFVGDDLAYPVPPVRRYVRKSYPYDEPDVFEYDEYAPSRQYLYHPIDVQTPRSKNIRDRVTYDEATPSSSGFHPAHQQRHTPQNQVKLQPEERSSTKPIGPKNMRKHKRKSAKTDGQKNIEPFVEHYAEKATFSAERDRGKFLQRKNPVYSGQTQRSPTKFPVTPKNSPSGSSGLFNPRKIKPSTSYESKDKENEKTMADIRACLRNNFTPMKQSPSRTCSTKQVSNEAKTSTIMNDSKTRVAMTMKMLEERKTQSSQGKSAPSQKGTNIRDLSSAMNRMKVTFPRGDPKLMLQNDHDIHDRVTWHKNQENDQNYTKFDPRKASQQRKFSKKNESLLIIVDSSDDEYQQGF